MLHIFLRIISTILSQMSKKVKSGTKSWNYFLKFKLQQRKRKNSDGFGELFLGRGLPNHLIEGIPPTYFSSLKINKNKNKWGFPSHFNWRDSAIIF
jgi:hypothetical protein